MNTDLKKNTLRVLMTLVLLSLGGWTVLLLLAATDSSLQQLYVFKRRGRTPKKLPKGHVRSWP